MRTEALRKTDKKLKQGKKWGRIKEREEKRLTPLRAEEYTFIAALYIDKDLEYVHTFMNVCFFPRLKEFILNQDWNDPKSQLQQCCLTLRTEGKEPDIPLYKTLQTVGPSHARTYTVAVYFKGERIGCGKGPSIQQAEMGAAMDALEK
ncbi:hypothetical protein AMECASPLE_027775, partial [Ameca splendens]